MNFTTQQVRDTCTRTIKVELAGAPDTASDGVPSSFFTSAQAFTIRPAVAELAYTWNGYGFELIGIVVRGPRMKRDGFPGVKAGSLTYHAEGTNAHGDTVWPFGTPAWVQILGKRYADPDNPTD
jgi:hypothetical protein